MSTNMAQKNQKKSETVDGLVSDRGDIYLKADLCNAIYNKNVWEIIINKLKQKKSI